MVARVSPRRNSTSYCAEGKTGEAYAAAVISGRSRNPAAYSGSDRPIAHYLWYMIATLINKDRQGFLDLCITNRVAYIYAFGSSVGGNFGPDSDVDVLLDVDVKEDLEAGRALWNVWDGLEALFQRPVDMLTEDSLRNPYLRKEIERTKVKVYDGASRQILV